MARPVGQVYAAETKKEEKAPTASGSIINSAKAEGHIRGFIAEHGDRVSSISRRLSLSEFSNHLWGHIRLKNISPKVN